jgi:hypothetical protein
MRRRRIVKGHTHFGWKAAKDLRLAAGKSFDHAPSAVDKVQNYQLLSGRRRINL